MIFMLVGIATGIVLTLVKAKGKIMKRVLLGLFLGLLIGIIPQTLLIGLDSTYVSYEEINLLPLQSKNGKEYYVETKELYVKGTFIKQYHINLDCSEDNKFVEGETKSEDQVEIKKVHSKTAKLIKFRAKFKNEHLNKLFVCMKKNKYELEIPENTDIYVNKNTLT